MEFLIILVLFVILMAISEKVGYTFGTVIVLDSLLGYIANALYYAVMSFLFSRR